jgi:hypothetical protein
MKDGKLILDKKTKEKEICLVNCVTEKNSGSKTRALFRLQIFSTLATVALSFVFGNYCPIVD